MPPKRVVVSRGRMPPKKRSQTVHMAVPKLNIKQHDFIEPLSSFKFVDWKAEIAKGFTTYFDSFQIEKDGKLYFDEDDKNALLAQDLLYQETVNYARYKVRQESKARFQKAYAEARPGEMHFYKSSGLGYKYIFTTFVGNGQPVERLTADDITKFLFNLRLNSYILKFSRQTEYMFRSSIWSGQRLVFTVDYFFNDQYGMIYINDPSVDIWESSMINGYDEMVKIVKTRDDDYHFHDGRLHVEFEKNHPLRTFIAHLQGKPQTVYQRWIFLTYLASRGYKARCEKSSDIASSAGDLDWLLQRYGGYQKIFTIEGDRYPLYYREDRVQCFVWVAKWAQSAFTQADFIQLDASFYAIEPYVYCIPTAIIKNESIPLGFVFGPSESTQLYKAFYDSLIKYTGINPSDKPVLSDEGTAIEAFCNLFNIEHYFCYRHLIEKFGAKSQISEFVRELLFSDTEKIFLSKWERLLVTMTQAYIASNPRQKTAFRKLFNVGFINNELTQPKFSSQSLWVRAEKHISTTTNHVESYHSKLNYYKKTNPRLNPLRYVEHIFFYISRRYTTFAYGRNFHNFVKRIKINPVIDEFTKSLYHIDEERFESLLANSFNDPELPVITMSEENGFEVDQTIPGWFFQEINEYPKILIKTCEQIINKFGNPEISEELYSHLVYGQTNIPNDYKEKLPLYFAWYCHNSFEKYVYEKEPLENFRLLMYGSRKSAPKSYKLTAKLILLDLENSTKIGISKSKTFVSFVKPLAAKSKNTKVHMCPNCGWEITK